MLIKTQGLVLKQRNIGENDRIITILSKELGIIEAVANGVKRMRSQLAGATQILCYSEFCLYKGKNHYSINSAEIIHTFYDLRLDVMKLSLAAYLCDLTSFLSPSGEGSWVYLRLLLNTFSMLEKSKRPEKLLKSIYELRVSAFAGFMPDLTCCSRCGAFEGEVMYFLPVASKILCEDCEPHICKIDTLRYKLSMPVLSAMRHIIYADDEKLFRFKLSGQSLEQLNFITQNYVLIYTDTTFKSLEMYQQMISLETNLPS